ncbi:lon protease homolog 2, peroxisomal [Nilaparvata lugens]|uniref:lon protease homolog 2, peroxisomal n=1 Tax=Nilaparvata lugens TaxID=108931 RepID=UPI00193E642C|nr:lon protease homolog 2, peroxisomal [Nilaparvata lugens]
MANDKKLKLPVVAIRSDIYLPGRSATINISGESNVNLMKKVLLMGGNLKNKVGFVFIKSEGKDHDVLEPSNLMSDIGTETLVTRVTFGPQSMATISFVCRSRFRIEKFVMEEPYPVAIVSPIHQQIEDDYGDVNDLNQFQNELESLVLDVLQSCTNSASLLAMKNGLKRLTPSFFVDMCASLVPLSQAEKLDLLETLGTKERMKKVISLLKSNFGDNVSVKPSQRSVQGSSNFQPKLIRIGHRGSPMDDDSDIGDLSNRLKKAKLPPHAEEVASKELKRLMNIGRYSSDYGVIRSYLELLAELPWDNSTEESINIKKAKLALDSQHYGLKKLKKRVLEFLAVRQLKKDSKGPILCFVGPPGVGKTSIARSVAHAMGRKFHQIALGGVCNQSDIRGHRKTYVGAMPGRIIQALKTTGVNNPVILLDEVDKMGIGTHSGDPSAALLEVLDPEQNTNFVDHYVNIPFDLSKVLFIASSNSHSKIPFALYDRLEVINIGGYSTNEKLGIAEQHLLPKVIHDNGLSEQLLNVPRDSLQLIISSYTKEAGVRSLEKKLSALCRSVAFQVAEQDTSGADQVQTASGQSPMKASLNSLTFPITLDREAVEKVLGPPIYDENVLWDRMGMPGVAAGLYVSVIGGSVSLVECFAFAKPKSAECSLQLTGKLGRVMKESAQLAWKWVRINYSKLTLYEEMNEAGALLPSPFHSEVHIHFPAGAVDKDGPSGGITIAVALVSLFLNTPVAPNLTMTGELSLKGFVLPVGGIKQKVLAAYEQGFKTVILPKLNQKDVSETPNEVKDAMEFVFVETMDDVLHAAFNGAVTLNNVYEHPLTSKL